MADNTTTLKIRAENQTDAAFRAIKSNMDALQNRMESFRNVAASLGGIYVMSGLVNMVRNSLEAVDAIGKLAQKTGIAVEQLSALSYAAKLSDVSTESLSKGIKSLSQKMTEAADPAGKAAKIFAALGVDATKGAAAGIDNIANAFARLPDGTTKAALAVELFGKAGMDMIPLLNQGSDGIKKMTDEAARFGLIVNEEAAKSAEAFNDNMKALTSGSQKLGIEIVNQLGPALVRITNAMKDAAAEGGLLKAALVGIGGVITELATGSKIAAMARNLADAQAELARIQQNATSNPIAMALRGDRIKALEDEIEQWKRLIEQEKYALELQRKRNAAEAQAPKQDKALESRIKSLLGGPTSNAGEQLLIDLQKQYEKLANEVNQSETRHAMLLELQKEAYRGVTAQIRDQIIAQAEKIDLLKKEIETRRFLDAEHQKELEFARARGEQLADLANSWADATKELEQESRLIGLSNVDRQKAILLEKARLDIIAAGDNASAIRDINDNLQKQIGLLDEINQKQKSLDVWNQLADSAGQFFSDLVFNGRSAFDNLKRSLKSFAAELVALFAKRWVLQMVASATGSSALSAAASQAGQGSLAGSFLNAGLGASGIGMGTFAEFFSSAAGTFMGPAAPGSAAAMGAEFAAFMTNPATLAVLAAVVIAVAVMSRRGGPKEGGSFFGTFDAEGNLTGTPGAPGTQNGRFYTPSGSDQSARDIGEAMGSSFATALRRFGGTSAGVGFGIGFDRDPRGTAPNRVSALVTDATGRVIYENINREAGRSEEDLQAALRDEANRALLAALQASELPQAIADILSSLNPYSSASEEIEAALAAAERIANLIDALAAIEIPGLDIEALRGFQRDGEQLEQTFARVGGLWSRYVDLFTTEAERLQQAQDLVTSTFEDLGIAVPDSMQAFKDLVAGLDLTTEAGRSMWERLMEIAPAFAAVQDAAGMAAERIAKIIDALAELKIPGIDIDVLRQFQRDGEELEQTFDRVGGLWSRYVDLFTTEAERLQQAQDLVTSTFEDLGVAVPDSMEAFKDLVAGLDLTTEAGRSMWERLMEIAPAFVAVQDAAARAAEAQREATRQMLEDAGISAEALAQIIRDGLLGRISEEEVGARMADIVVGGIYNALVNTYAQQITQIMLDGIIMPMVTAATTGAAISAVASQASIDAMVAQVSALTELLAALFNDPAFKEAMDRLREAISSVAGSIVAVQDAAARAAAAQREATRQMLQDAGISAEALAQIIRDGLLGRISEEEVGARMAEMVVGGIYNALANTYAAQITQIMLDGIITPMVTAATTGAAISAAASQASIDAMVAQVTALTEAFAELLNNPAFKEAMDRLREAIGSVAGSIGSAGGYVPPGYVGGGGGGAPDNSTDRILNERLSLERQLLELQGNTVEIRRRELEALDPSNRALQEHIWRLEDEAKAAAKAAELLRQRGDLEIRIMELTGNSAGALAARRQLELAAADESLRPLLLRIYALEDEARAANEAADSMREIVSNIDALKQASDNVRQSISQLRDTLPGFNVVGARQQDVRDAYGAFSTITDSTPVAERIRRAQAYQQALLASHSAQMAQLEERAQAERQAYEADLAARREAADAANQLTLAFRELGDFAKSILVGDQSPLSATERLAELQRQYAAALSGASAGNLDAINELPTLANARLQSARQNAATLVDYQRQALGVQRDLAALGERGNRDLVEVVDGGFTISAGLQQEMNKLTQDTIDSLKAIDDVLQGWIEEQQAALEDQAKVFASINDGIVEMVLNTRGLDQRIADAIGRARQPASGQLQTPAGVSASRTRPSADTPASADDVRVMREELNAALIAVAQNTSKTARLLQRWEGDGLPDTRVVA